MKVIERLRHENLPIPQKYKDLYGNEMTEMNFNIPHNVANFVDKGGKPTESLNKAEFDKLSKQDKVRLQLIKQKKANEEKKENFIK